MRYEFAWDPVKERLNARKHRLAFRDAAAVFRDPNQLSIYDEDHSEREDRWVTIGLDCVGMLCVVVHTFEYLQEGVCRIRIISARRATAAEARQYENVRS